MTNFKDKHIFKLGGMGKHTSRRVTEVYNLATNLWSKSRSMNIARAYSSSCALGDYIFIFGSLHLTKTECQRIEKINAQKLLDGEPEITWGLIVIQ